jgi:hypothetical protein
MAPEWHLAKEAPLAATSADDVVADVRLVVILALERLAFGVNFDAECDRTVLSGFAFGDLGLDGANSGADGEDVQFVNWMIRQGEVGLEEYAEEIARETLNCP